MSFQLEKRLNTHCSTQCHYVRELHYMTNATKNREAKLSLELEKKNHSFLLQVTEHLKINLIISKDNLEPRV